jgi:translation initiation factor IF-1
MGTITETVPVSVAVGQAQTQMVTISAVPVGEERKIKIQILEGDKVVSQQSKK